MRAVHHDEADSITNGITDGGPHGLAICEPHDVAVGESLNDTDIRPVAQPEHIAVGRTHMGYFIGSHCIAVGQSF